ncbi:hypothetical protein GCM10010971_00020 [Silvimonas amylolytica]|uniref:Uncharacterized protein n=1 Tax=Silvimonas amylolytica TaxID=449663 RepID=A0ABQ2PFR8_9NEIS|nr:hypothetical protein GCM10010971_00020 [Silvimonas amylolytica]
MRVKGSELPVQQLQPGVVTDHICDLGVGSQHQTQIVCDRSETRPLVWSAYKHNTGNPL